MDGGWEAKKERVRYEVMKMRGVEQWDAMMMIGDARKKNIATPIISKKYTHEQAAHISSHEKKRLKRKTNSRSMYLKNERKNQI